VIELVKQAFVGALRGQQRGRKQQNISISYAVFFLKCSFVDEKNLLHNNLIWNL